MKKQTPLPKTTRALSTAGYACWLLLGAGCPHSTVWLGDGWGGAGATAHHAATMPQTDGGAPVPDAGEAEATGPQLPAAAAQSGAGGVNAVPNAATSGRAAHAAAGSVAAGSAGRGLAGGQAQAGAMAGAGGSGALPRLEPKLPPLPATCPKLATGTINYRSVAVQLWINAPSNGPAVPLMVYWHSTGATPDEASSMAPGFSELMQRGVLIAPQDTTLTGRDTGDPIWYAGDFDVVDSLIACAVDQLNIDTRRIYAAGSSAGGLQSGAMAYERSNYLAAVAANSGGLFSPAQWQNPAHMPAVITMHGSRMLDVVLLNFADSSLMLARDVVAKGGYAVDCGHGGGHIAAPSDLLAAAWQFLEDHPFGQTPEPYGMMLPASFPKYCQVQ